MVNSIELFGNTSQLIDRLDSNKCNYVDMLWAEYLI